MRNEYSPQLDLFSGEKSEKIQRRMKRTSRSGAFVDNMALPIHRWFRYSAGFSADWVRSLVGDYRSRSDSISVLDPFAGVGTTLLACNAENVKSYGYETHPFVYRIATIKANSMLLNVSSLKAMFTRYLSDLDGVGCANQTEIPKLLEKCYSPIALDTLFRMRYLFRDKYDKKSPESEVLWLAITSILRSCSGAGTAQWQYVLPNKSKSRVTSPVVALREKAFQMIQDIEFAQQQKWSSQAQVINHDARESLVNHDFMVEAVITSPPYPNNYDYADATRLEMTFWGDVSGWGDLQGAVRQYLIRSCSQHAAAEKLVLDDVLSDRILQPIRSELTLACEKLAEIRMTKGGRKNYHTMAAAYFRDLGLVFKSLREVCLPDSKLCFVIGDSAPYGVYLNVDKWLGELATAVGFESYSFEKIRDRNVKWKNRKHRVPLQEGRLWIKG